MKRITIFGESYRVTEQKSSVDEVELKEGEIVVKSSKMPPEALLTEFLSSLLYGQLVQIYDQIRREGKIEILGNLDFEIVEKIDNRRQRIAKSNGNVVTVKINTVSLPRSALKYIVAHELAHVFTKRHTRRFWKIVETIYPNFEEGRNLVLKYRKLLSHPLLRLSEHP